ncbi:MAG: anti-sigma factor domain-containing protein [Acidimicrobiales bacterium]
MSSESTLHDLAPAYALNALDDDERARFEAHLERCQPCQAEVAEVNETMAALATETATDPPSGLRGNVLASISETEQLPAAERQAQPPIESTSEPAIETPIDLAGRRERGPRRLMPLAAAAAVAVIAAASFAILRSGTADDNSVDIAEVAAAVDARAVELGAGEGVTGTVEVVWSAELSAVSVVAADLSDPGPGQVYELWFVLDEGVVAPAGLFTPQDGAFTGVLNVDELTASGWGVTIEPAGGSDQPTGAILYFAEL